MKTVQFSGLDVFAEKKAAKSAKRKRQKERRKLKKAQSVDNQGQIQTVASQNKKVDPAVIVEYKNPRKRRKEANSPALNDSKPSVDEELTMKQARFDVFKFGVKGFDKQGQLSAREALAVKLGAKPAKNKCLPYEEYKQKLKEERSKQRQEKEERRNTTKLRTSARAAPSANRPDKKKPITPKTHSKKGSKGGRGLQPKFGKFDGGMLKLSSKDIANIKSKK